MNRSDRTYAEVNRRFAQLLEDIGPNGRFPKWPNIIFDDQFRAGRLPGNQENIMSKFLFPLGASVVLITSLAAAQTEADERDAKLFQQAEQEAERARNQVFMANGRHDLVPRQATDGAGSWRGATLKSFVPIEAGEVIARAEYPEFNDYLVRYRSGCGAQVEQWHREKAIAWDPRVSDRLQPPVDPTPEQIRSDD